MTVIVHQCIMHALTLGACLHLFAVLLRTFGGSDECVVAPGDVVLITTGLGIFQLPAIEMLFDDDIKILVRPAVGAEAVDDEMLPVGDVVVGALLPAVLRDELAEVVGDDLVLDGWKRVYLLERNHLAAGVGIRIPVDRVALHRHCESPHIALRALLRRPGRSLRRKSRKGKEKDDPETGRKLRNVFQFAPEIILCRHGRLLTL